MKTKVGLLGIGVAGLLLAGLAVVIGGIVVWQMWPSTAATSRPVRILAAVPLPTPVSPDSRTAPPVLADGGPNGAIEDLPPPPRATPLLSQSQPVTQANLLPTQPPVDEGNATEPPLPLMRLVIPRLTLDVPVFTAPIKNNTWQVDHLAQNVGHLEGTALPGSNSNIVLAGHVRLQNGTAGPFAALPQLMPSDEVLLYHNDQQFRFVVDARHTVPKTAIEVTHPSNSSRLTLITCSTWDDTSSSYQERLVVQGHLE